MPSAFSEQQWSLLTPGQRLRYFMSLRSLSVAQLASASGVSPTTVRRALHNAVTLKRVTRLKLVFGVGAGRADPLIWEDLASLDQGSSFAERLARLREGHAWNRSELAER